MNDSVLMIDGSRGEGGGQILRTSLSLSLVTGRPVRIENIRAGRKKPGLGRQHLTAVEAARETGRAEVEGNFLGSGTLFFRPTGVFPGRYRFAVGTAGSCTLVLQTVLPPLLVTGERSELVLEGGTHNPFAPPFDFLERAFIPLLRRMGPRVAVRLHRPGFYPAGGGEVSVRIESSEDLELIELTERGALRSVSARALVSRLPRKIAERELAVVRQRLGWEKDVLEAEEIRGGRGPGNVLVLTVEFENVTEVFTGFGRRGVPAEEVAREACAEASEYLASGVPVGRRLADQLLLPLALAGGGNFRTLSPSMHTRTNAEVIEEFLPVSIRIREEEKNVWEVRIRGR